MSGPGMEPDVLVRLAEEFAERYRKGERPALSEYTARHPDLAEQIRDLFPALMVMEEFGSVAGPAAAPRRGDGQVPPQLGEYRLLREVARGGMGVVYEAVQESLGRHVALKVLPFPGLGDSTHLERFRREAQAAARLHHTNIVPVFGVGEHQGVHYYAMQFIQGQSLDAVIQELRLRGRAPKAPGEGPSLAARGLLTGQFAGSPPATEAVGRIGNPSYPSPESVEVGRIGNPSHVGPKEPPADKPLSSPARGPAGDADTSSAGPSSSSGLAGQSKGQYFRGVARLGVQVAEALGYAHGQGVLHRDIKPSNLLLDAHGTVWVTDFGLAKAEGTEELTQTGDLLGTLRYMAPERFQGRADPRSDVYGLGVTLYELLTLCPAFDDSHRARLIERVTRVEPAPPRKRDPGIPRDLETVVLKAIAKEPGDRYPTAVGLADDLRRFLADRPIEARRTAALERAWRWCRRNPAVARLTASVAFLLVTVAVVSVVMAVLLWRERDAARRAEGEKTERLWDAYLAHARAGRLTGEAGRRFNGLDALDKARALLPSLPPDDRRLLDLRDEYLACLALADLQATPTWEKLPETAGLGFDRAFEHYARSDRQGAISIHRVDDDEEIARLPAQGQPAWVLCFSPDGRFLTATYSARYWTPPNRFRVWDWRRGEAVVVAEPSDFYGIVDFSPDSRRVAAGRIGGAVHVYPLTADAGGLKQLAPGFQPDHVAFHPDGRTLAVSSSNGTVQLRDADTGVVRATLSHPGAVHAIAWRPDGKLLAAGCPSDIYLWDVETRRRHAVLSGHQSAVTSLDFSHGGDLLASASWDGTARLWDVEARRQLVRAPTGPSNVQLLFSPDDRWLGLTGFGLKLMRWQVAQGRECRLLDGHRGLERGETHVSFSPDGRLLASASRGVALWDWSARRPVAYLPVASGGPALFPPDGRCLLSPASEGLVRWALTPASGEAGGALRIGPPETLLKTPLAEAALGNDGRALLARSQAGQLLVLDLEQSAPPVFLNALHDAWSVAFSPDGRWAAAGTWFGSRFRVWNAQSGEAVLSLELSARVGFSPDGRFLVTSGPDESRLWEVASWRLRRIIPKQPEGLRVGAAFAPDGRMMAVVHSISLGQVHLIDPESDRVFARLQVPEQTMVVSLAFSPDGAQLAAACAGDVVRVWDLRAIRRQLAEKGLDWDQPPYSPPVRKEDEKTLRVDVLLNAPLYEAQALRLVSENKFDAAVAQFEKALELELDRPASCTFLAWIHTQGPAHLRDLQKALPLALRAVAKAPEDAISQSNLGAVYYRLDRYQDAIQVLEGNLGRKTTAPFDLLFLAMSRHRLGDAAKARAHYYAALDRWLGAGDLPEGWVEELKQLRLEAAALLGIEGHKK